MMMMMTSLPYQSIFIAFQAHFWYFISMKSLCSGRIHTKPLNIGQQKKETPFYDLKFQNSFQIDISKKKTSEELFLMVALQSHSSPSHNLGFCVKSLDAGIRIDIVADKIIVQTPNLITRLFRQIQNCMTP